MKQIYANNFITLSLGRQGENLARQVVFDIQDLESLYGSGTVEVIYQRPGDELPYPLAVRMDGTIVTWDVTATDTEMSDGYGKCELRYYVGETLAKSKTWRTWVDHALQTPSETAPPEPEQGWVDQVVAVGAAAQASADAAKANADRAAALAAEVAEKAAQTAQDASDAAKAMEAAQTAQRLAEEAQRAAKAARTAAAAAQSAAEKAATDAAGAKQGAETAMQAAQDAAAAAANALEAIQTLYQEMQTWAQGVIQDVNAAGSIAVQSVQSAGDTQVQRVTDEGTTQTANAKAQADAAAQSASGAAQSAQEAAESAAVYDNVVADVNQLKQDIAAITPDDTAVNGKPWTSKKIVDSLCQPIEESGNPVQCYPVENYPLGVTVQMEPIQEGNGDPSPDNIRPITGMDTVSVTRCGKNLINKNTAIVGDMVFGADGTPANYPDVAVNYVKVKPNTLYTLAYEYAATSDIMYCRLAYLNEKREFIVRKTILGSESGKKKTYSFTTTSETHWLQLGMNNVVDGFNHNYSMSLCEGDTACDYEPYADTTDIALPETVYGGTLDVETGVLTVTHCFVTLTGNEDWGKAGNYLYAPITPKGKSRISGACSHFPFWDGVGDFDYVAGNYVAHLGWGFVVAGGIAEQYTVDGFKAYLASQKEAGTPVQVCYGLDKPYTIQLTPQQITALSGVNTIYTDADGVIVTGAEDPKHTITELKNAIISLGGNV